MNVTRKILKQKDERVMTDGQEINMLKLEVAALKQQLHTERESLKKEADELMIKKIEHYEKEIALVREDAQVQILAVEKVQIDLRRRNLELETINKEHQKLNGELREDNKKLAKQVDDLLSRLDKLRHLGVL